MAPHCTNSELALVRKWQGQGLTAKEMLGLHRADRTIRRVQPICFSTFKKLLRGTTHKGGLETLARKRKLGARAVRALDAKRRQLVESTYAEIALRIYPSSHLMLFAKYTKTCKTSKTNCKTTTETCKTSKTTQKNRK